MENILYTLFNGEYDITPKPGKKQQELCDQIFTELDKAKAVLGDSYIDHLFALMVERTNLENFQYYRSGIQLGVCLMLEALGG